MDNENNVVHDIPSDAMSVEEATTIEQPNTDMEAATQAALEQATETTEESAAEVATETAEETTQDVAEEPTEEPVAETSESVTEEATTEQPTESANEPATEPVKEPMSKMKAHAIGYAVGAGVFIILVIIRLIVLDNNINELKEDLKVANEEKRQAEMDLEREKTALEEKIALLSDKVAVQIVADEEAEAKKVPSGLPVTGRVSIIAEPVFVDEDGDGEPDGEMTAYDDNGDHTWTKPIESDDGEDTIIDLSDAKITALPIVFGASEGSKVVASGAGKVLTIESDDTYGNAVIIDHENGYMTIYTYTEEPKVNVGDEILKGQLIFDVTANNAEVEFQVFYNDEPMDPMDIIMISG